MYTLSRHAVIHTEKVSGKVSDLRLDFSTLTEAVFGFDLCIDIFQVNYFSSHPEMRARFSMRDADRPVEVFHDISPSPFLST